MFKISLKITDMWLRIYFDTASRELLVRITFVLVVVEFGSRLVFELLACVTFKR